MLKFKRFIIILFSVLLFFNTFLYRVDFNTFLPVKQDHIDLYTPRADVGVGAMVLGGGGISGIGLGEVSSLASAFNVAAPYIVGALSVAVLAGVVFNNRTAIMNYLENFFSNDSPLPSTASDYFEEIENNRVRVKSHAIQDVKDNLSALISPNSGSVVFNGHIASGEILKLSPSGFSSPIILKLTFSNVVHTYNTRLSTYFYSLSRQVRLYSNSNYIYKNTNSSDNISYIVIGLNSAVNKLIISSNGALSVALKSLTYTDAPICPSISSDYANDIDNLQIRLTPYSEDYPCDCTIESIPYSTLTVENDYTYTPSSYVPSGETIDIPNSLSLDSYVGDTAYDQVVENVENPPSSSDTDTPVVSGWDWLKSILQKILDAILGIPSFLEIISTAVTYVPTVLDNIWDWCGGLATSIGSALSGFFEGVQSVCVDIGNTLSNIWDWCGTVASSIGSAVGSALSGFFEGVQSVCVDIGNTLINIWDWCGTVASAIGSAVVTPIIDFFTFDDTIDLKIEGLDTVFPFSIPFDIYKIFVLFNAEPVAPTVSFDVDYLVGKGSIDINIFKDYPIIGQFCRSFFTILYLVGLALGIKKFTDN